MNFISDIAKNIAHTKLLQERYQKLTGWVGTFSGLFGMLMLLMIVHVFLPAFGVDIEAPNEDPTLFGAVMIGLAIVAIFTFSVLIGVSVFSFFMFLTGKLTNIEAKNYALRFRYPKSWYQSQYSFLAETDEDKP